MYVRLGNSTTAAFLWYIVDWGMPYSHCILSAAFATMPVTFTYIALACIGDRWNIGSNNMVQYVVIASITVQLASVWALAYPPVIQSLTLLTYWLCLWSSCMKCTQVVIVLAINAWMMEKSKDSNDYMNIQTLAVSAAGGLGTATGICLSSLLTHGAFAVIHSIGLTASFLLLMIKVFPMNTPSSSPSSPPATLGPHIIPSIRICAKTSEFQVSAELISFAVIIIIITINFIRYYSLPG